EVVLVTVAVGKFVAREAAGSNHPVIAVGLIANGRTEARRPLAAEGLELGKGLREAAFDGPRGARGQLVVGRPEYRHADGAVLPDLAAGSDLELEVVHVEIMMESIGVAIVDHPQVPGDLAGHRLNAQIPIHLDIGIVGQAVSANTRVLRVTPIEA